MIMTSNELNHDAYSGEASRLINETIQNAYDNVLILNEHSQSSSGRASSLASLHTRDAINCAIVSIELDRRAEMVKKDMATETFWSTIGEFSEEIGKQKIQEYLKTWNRDERWLYCIDCLGVTDKSYSTETLYRVRWSIPTRRKPIPRATASVYFTFISSKIKSKDHPVEVYFVFESTKLVHKPETSVFKEKWLTDIIESKSVVMDTFVF